MILDKRLVYLQSYLSQNDNTMELYEYIGVSKRQLSRLISSWQEAGYIEYTGGSGRGNKLSITMKIDAEKELFYYAIENAKNMELNELQEYINLPWHAESRESVIEALISEFHDESQSHGFLLDYVFDIPPKLYKGMPHDIVSYQICDNISETLYVCNSDKLDNQLVKFDEWIDASLHIHLTKDAYFDDNVQLKSEHVVSIIDSLCKSKEYQLYFKMVQSLEIVNDFHFIIHCTHKAPHIKLLLSEPVTAIVKENDGMLHGTGKYYVLKHAENEIILNANPYHKRQPQIKKVFIVKNQSKIRADYSKEKQDLSIKFIMGNGLVVCNPKTKLNQSERKYFSTAFLNYLKAVMQEERSDFEWLLKDTDIHLKEEMPSVSFLSNEHNFETFQNIFDRMERELGIKVIHKKVEHKTYLKTHLDEYDVDFIFMMETFIQKNPLAFYDMLMHCKCKDWLLQMDGCKSFVEAFDLEKFEEMKFRSDSKLEWLEDEGYLVNAYLKYRFMNFPSYIDYVDMNKYGYLDYGSAIIE
ncbi:hypothetical protein ROU88_11635 [Macrococcus capreoli]